jgi:hypothetical protein
MKKSTLVLLLAFSIPAIAQKNEGKNMGKINLSAFAFKGFGLQYERQIGPRITVGLGYSMIPKTTLAVKSIIENSIDDPDVNVGEFRLGTSIFTPEFRYYFGKKGAFHGFYLAPYARIGTYKVEGPVSYTSSTNTKKEAIFDGKLNTVTGGLMIGSSWQLSDRFYLDWWILGASFGGANGNLLAQTPLTPTEQRSLKQELDDIEVIGTKIKSEVNSTGATVTTSGTIAGVRGLGLNFGIRF